MKFGENLYNLRKSAKMSQEKLAEKVGVSRQSVSKWENGESYPEMDKILKLCDIFHCKINDLVHENLVDIDSLDEEIKMSVVKFKKEKQSKMKGLSKAIYIIARIGKIIVTIAIPIVLFCMIFMPYLISNIDVVDNEIIFNGSNDKITIVEKSNDNNISLELKYNDMLLADATDENTVIIQNMFANNSKVKIIICMEIGFLVLTISVILMRIILKHLEELFININNGDTPFTLENVSYIKKIAYLMIAVIILPNIFGIFFELIMNFDFNIGFELFDVVQILFLFSMAYIFEYGYELQQDTKAKMYGEVSDNE